MELLPNWFRIGLFGFALSAVVSGSKPMCKLKNSPGKDYCYDQHHVYVWNESSRSEEVAKKRSLDVYKLANEASVKFSPVDGMKVESCGTSLLYAEDAEKFKFDHDYRSREPKVEESGQDDNSEGGGSSEFKANESDDHGSEASGTDNDLDF